jgi:hypothetical protein
MRIFKAKHRLFLLLDDDIFANYNTLEFAQIPLVLGKC